MSSASLRNDSTGSSSCRKCDGRGVNGEPVTRCPHSVLGLPEQVELETRSQEPVLPNERLRSQPSAAREERETPRQIIVIMPCHLRHWLLRRYLPLAPQV